MATYQYLSLTPESLVASMLPPEEFGRYMAVGTAKHTSGQAIFFTLKSSFDGKEFGLDAARKRCVPHTDGEPKHSVYAAIYRVLERVPLDAIESLWLTTAHGRAMELKPGTSTATASWKYHLYRELVPVHPLIASSLGPTDFVKFITDPSNPIYVPRICMVELELAGLATDPARGRGDNLPYQNLDHIRSCLGELGKKAVKTVDRLPQQSLMYRCIKGGIHLGDRERIISFPFPSIDDLELHHDAWWRCANDSELVWSV
jgi:hypothetical protein